MRLNIRIITIALFTLGLAYLFEYNTCNKAALTFTVPLKEPNQKTILIDPGHGGMDGGAVSKRGALEKHINLSISLKLRDKLEEYGYKVIMTREEDTGLYSTRSSLRLMKLEDLNKRCHMKKESNCDIFISIHQNFFPENKYHGAQVWYAKSESSKLLAQLIQRNLIETLNKDNKREEKLAGNDYRILRCYLDIPSVIVECGFLTNPREEMQLRDEAYQQLIADSIAESVNAFFAHEDENTDQGILKFRNIFQNLVY
jgi:N-acetylmuramoyl-L-alanine amidase